MSKVGVSLKINTSMIDMNRLFQGQKGNYLDATVFIDLDQLDQYGNSGMITQDVSKEEKAQGVKGSILGNCKVFWSDSGNAPQQAQQGFQQQPMQQAPQQHMQAPPQVQTMGAHQAHPVQQPQGQAQGFDQPDDDIPF